MKNAFCLGTDRAAMLSSKERRPRYRSQAHTSKWGRAGLRQASDLAGGMLTRAYKCATLGVE
jgi:hypothetical protein